MQPEREVGDCSPGFGSRASQGRGDLGLLLLFSQLMVTCEMLLWAAVQSRAQIVMQPSSIARKPTKEI